MGKSKLSKDEGWVTLGSSYVSLEAAVSIYRLWARLRDATPWYRWVLFRQYEAGLLGTYIQVRGHRVRLITRGRMHIGCRTITWPQAKRFAIKHKFSEEGAGKNVVYHYDLGCI